MKRIVNLPFSYPSPTNLVCRISTLNPAHALTQHTKNCRVKAKNPTHAHKNGKSRERREEEGRRVRDELKKKIKNKAPIQYLAIQSNETKRKGRKTE